MKSKTKKILTAICAMILSVFMFAGCNLIEVNKGKYYNQEVITIGLKDGYGDEYKSYVRTYSKKDLLNAYYNYSYSYVNQGQLDVEAGIDYAINNMINSDLLYNYVKTNYYDNAKYDLDFTDADKNDVKLEAFDSMQDSIFEIENEIFKEWDIQFTGADDLSDEEVKTLRASYEEYIPSVVVQEIDGKEVIVLNEVEIDVHDTRVAPEHFIQQIRDKAVSKEAYTRYIKQLQDAAKAEGVEDTSEKAVLYSEEQRLIDAYTKSKYMEKFEKWYNKYYNFTYDSENDVYVLNEDIQNQIVESYKQEFIEQKDIYSQDEKAYHTAMGDDVSKVYYHQNSGNEYVYVSHILLKFSDAQLEEIGELDKKLESKVITQERYDELVADIANRTKVTYEIDGIEYTANADEVYERITGYVNTADEVINNPDANEDEKHAALVEKAKRFNDMIYLYNDDEGIMNADYAYVVNLDTNVTDKMVAPFANKAREMHANGVLGSVSDMVITEYGVHIMFYAGEVKNVVEDINTLTAIDLIKHNTQLSSAKSLFSLAYDEISVDAYTTSASNYISDCYEFITITKYEDRYKDLYK